MATIKIKATERYQYFDYVISKENDEWRITLPTGQSGRWKSLNDAISHADYLMVDRFCTIRRFYIPKVEYFLKDYLHKLEVDEYDPCAVQKMKEVNRFLDKLEEV